MGVIFRSDRTFKVWLYSVSHQVLLLRSSRSDDASTRIDILFPGVERMVLKSKYEGLCLRDIDPIDMEDLEVKYGRSAAPVGVWMDDERVDFVAPSNPQWHEDQGSDLDPSFFAPYLRVFGVA